MLKRDKKEDEEGTCIYFKNEFIFKFEYAVSFGPRNNVAMFTMLFRLLVVWSMSFGWNQSSLRNLIKLIWFSTGNSLNLYSCCSATVMRSLVCLSHHRSLGLLLSDVDIILHWSLVCDWYFSAWGARFEQSRVSGVNVLNLNKVGYFSFPELSCAKWEFLR